MPVLLTLPERNDGIAGLICEEHPNNPSHEKTLYLREDIKDKLKEWGLYRTARVATWEDGLNATLFFPLPALTQGPYRSSLVSAMLKSFAPKPFAKL